MNRFFSPIVALLLTGCAVSPPVEERFTLSEEVREFCELLLVDTDAEIKRLLRPYGKPDGVDVETIPNKHDPEVKDEIHTARYDNGRVVVYSVPSIGRNYLLEVVLTEAFWPDELPNLIGQSAEEVAEYFGKPNRINGNDPVYFCSPEADQYVQLHMSLGWLTRLEIKGWVD